MMVELLCAFIEACALCAGFEVLLSIVLPMW